MAEKVVTMSNGNLGSLGPDISNLNRVISRANARESGPNEDELMFRIGEQVSLL